MSFITENVRLAELVAIVNLNKGFYDEFVAYLRSQGFDHVLAFVNETDETKATATILGFLRRTSLARLHDGVSKPYEKSKAAWYFLSWLFRDAPAQRLNPLVTQMPGATAVEKQANLLNTLRTHVRALFPERPQWEWPAVSEVMLARLEGSRRALRGNLFEGIVRRCLQTAFKKHGLELKIGDKEVKINDETYDVQIYGQKRTVLMPVKTRETMGGGHALLFTRDIHKSISVAVEAGYECVPVIIAESWGGNLDGLACKHHIYIQANPNQLDVIEPMILTEIERVLAIFESLNKR